MVAALSFVIVVGLYAFMFHGDVSESADGRAAIHLTANEKELVLTEMRAFLVSVQEIAKGVADNNMKHVAEHSRKSGKVAQSEMPASLAAKLPQEFRQLGFDTHTKFDQLAMDANELEDAQLSLSQLSTLMQNCTACHAMYRIGVINY
jgi:hypothetical protein